MFSSQNSQVSSDANYIEDVFSTYLYTGNAGTQTVNNGIDLSTYGGMVWTKSRSNAYAHSILDTARGFNYSGTQTKRLDPSTTDNQADSAGNATQASPLTNGFSITTSGGGAINFYNASGATYASWAIRKQPKFYTQGIYTGTGSAQTITHDLGSTPGFIIIKGMDNSYAWVCYHRSLGATQWLALSSTQQAFTNSTIFNNTEPTDTTFTVGTSNAVSESGKQFVYYVFAHNAGGFGLTGTDNVISCGSFTTDGSGFSTVNLGYEPQWLLMKDTQSSTIYDNWYLIDNMRGFLVNGNATELYANKADAENANVQRAGITSTGFIPQGLNANKTYIYIAIRRGPMKVPTDATKVFAPFYASYSEAAAITTDFPIDLSMWKGDVTYNWSWQDRLRGTPTSTGSGGPSLASNSNASETTSYTAVGITKLDSNTRGSVSYQADSSRSNAAAYFMLRRSPSFFDEVCYTGTGSATTVTHNLGVPPELWIVKKRSSGTNRPWRVGYGSGTTYMAIDSSDPAYASSNPWNNTAPTSSVFTVGVENATNESSATFVSYLFATCAGVSKVGSYTGNGSTQTINCGFTGGARFVMIKQTSGSGGDWYVYSSALGIVAGNDRTVLFNSSSSSSAFGDTLDAFASGFELGPNSASFGNNTNGETYIFLAIA